MKTEIIITGFSKATSKGVILHLNEKTSLKTGNVLNKEFWVSWDKIGRLIFDNYTDKIAVSDLRDLRGENLKP